MRAATLVVAGTVLLSAIFAAPHGKRDQIKGGLAWPSAAYSVNIGPLNSPELGWNYNWGPTPYAYPGPGPFVSMIFDGQSPRPAVPDGIPESSVVLGFNEADGCNPGQACMKDVNYAVDEWVRTMGPLAAGGHRVCSPSVATDLGWLINFLNTCKSRSDCPVPDCIQAHVYQTNPDAVVGYLSHMHEVFPDKSIWVTEFACHNFDGGPQPANIEEVKAFMDKTTGWMASTPWIERYSWFGAGPASELGGVNPLNRLQNDDNSLTELGNKYLFSRHA